MSSVDDETILDVLRNSDDPRLTTTEVAERLPITRGTTRTRLQALADEGRLTREREGRDVVWWLPERVDEVSEASASAANGDEVATSDRTAPATADEEETEGSVDAEGSEGTGEPDTGTDDADAGGTETAPGGEDGPGDEPTGEASAPSSVEPLPGESRDRTVRAALALVALAVLYALVRRLRG